MRSSAFLALLLVSVLLLLDGALPFALDPVSCSCAAATRKQSLGSVFSSQQRSSSLLASASSGGLDESEESDIASFRAALEVSLAGISSERGGGGKTWVSKVRAVNELNLLMALATTRTISEEEAAIGDLWRFWFNERGAGARTKLEEVSEKRARPRSEGGEKRRAENARLQNIDLKRRYFRKCVTSLLLTHLPFPTPHFARWPLSLAGRGDDG